MNSSAGAAPRPRRNGWRSRMCRSGGDRRERLAAACAHQLLAAENEQGARDAADEAESAVAAVGASEARPYGAADAVAAAAAAAAAGATSGAAAPTETP